MTGNEYLQFMARKFTDFIAMPEEKSKKAHPKHHEKRKLRKIDWFGNVPFYLSKMIQKEK